MSKTNRPLAIVLAAAIVSLLWVPTLSLPAQAATTSIPVVELA